MSAYREHPSQFVNEVQSIEFPKSECMVAKTNLAHALAEFSNDFWPPFDLGESGHARLPTAT